MLTDDSAAKQATVKKAFLRLKAEEQCHEFAMRLTLN